MLDFNKTDLKENILIITNDDGSITCIPEDGATENEKAMFAEFRAKYPDGKPVEPVEKQEPIPTETELLKQQISDLENYILQKEVQESIK